MRLGRSILMVVVFVCCVFAGYAQSVDITGTVVEEKSGTAIEQATIRLLNVRDSTFIGGVASGRNGSFTLKNIRAGSYLLHITFVGYDPLYQPLQITGRTNPVNLGKLGMSDGSIMLGEAVVMGKAAEVVVRNDTIEYNADSFKVTEGSMLEDLLKKMPGVEVSEEGKVTVNGKEVQKVLVDGKEFFSEDPKVATKNLPSNMVDKVQVLQRLSEMSRMTGFDDGEEETVINLTVKPGMKSGWIGNASAGYGSKERYEGNVMINRLYNDDQLSLMGGLNNTNNMGFSESGAFSGMGGGGRGGFGGGRGGITSSWNTGLNFSKKLSLQMVLGGNGRFSHSDNDTYSNTKTTNTIVGEPGGSSTKTYDFDNSYRNNLSNNAGVGLRMEWKPDEVTSLIFRPNFSYSESKVIEQGSSYGLDADMDTTYVGSADYHSEGKSYNLSGQLNFSRRMNDDGRIFSASLSGGYSDTNSDGYNQTITDYVSRTDDIRDQLIKNDNTGFNYRAYVSWVEPLGRNNFVQLAYSLSQRKQDQFKNAYNKDDGGAYTVIDTAQTQNFRNDYINQRASLSFKSIRAKFNYTIGFNVDPSYSRSERFIGDTTLSNITQNVVNFSPTAQFRFNFSKQSNLRIDYDGRTSQASMTQLQPVPDYTNPKDVRIGNPDLKPRYTNNMSARYQFFDPVSQLSLVAMADGSFTVNDIVNYIIYDADNSGFRTTTYDNINGNYRANLRFMFNTPLKNRKFTVNTMTMGGYSESNEYVGNYADNGIDVTKTKGGSTTLSVSERAGINFRSTYLDLGINGNITYNKVRSSLNETLNADRYNYGVGGNTTIYLPYEFRIESDVAWSANSGYDSGYELNEVLWNASMSKSFLKGNQAMLRIKFYDILQQRSNVSVSTNATRTTFSEYNTLSSYFMVQFTYRFSIFKGGASMDDVFRGGRGGGRPPGGRGPGFGG